MLSTLTKADIIAAIQIENGYSLKKSIVEGDVRAERAQILEFLPGNLIIMFFSFFHNSCGHP